MRFNRGKGGRLFRNRFLLKNFFKNGFAFLIIAPLMFSTTGGAGILSFFLKKYFYQIKNSQTRVQRPPLGLKISGRC